MKPGRCKTWTLKSGLDYGLDIMDSILDLTSCFGTFQGFTPFLIASSLVPKICIFSAYMVGLRPRQCIRREVIELEVIELEAK